MVPDGQTALHVAQQRAVHAREITNARRKSVPFHCQFGRASSVGIVAGNGLGRDRTPFQALRGLGAQAVFESAPLPAEFSLMRRPSGNRFGVVAPER